MSQREVITEDTIQAALDALDRRIATPPPPSEVRYSRKEAFLKLRAKAKEALAAGHSLETVLDDLRGVGLGMTISTARQYLKPGKKPRRSGSVAKRETTKMEVSPPSETTPKSNLATKRGTFAVIDDEKEI